MLEALGIFLLGFQLFILCYFRAVNLVYLAVMVYAFRSVNRGTAASVDLDQLGVRVGDAQLRPISMLIPAYNERNTFCTRSNQRWTPITPRSRRSSSTTAPRTARSRNCSHTSTPSGPKSPSAAASSMKKSQASGARAHIAACSSSASATAASRTRSTPASNTLVTRWSARSTPIRSWSRTRWCASGRSSPTTGA